MQNQSARARGRGWAAEEEGGEYAERASSKQPSGVEPTVTHRTIQVLLLNSREIGEGGRGGGGAGAGGPGSAGCTALRCRANGTSAPYLE